MKNIMNNPISLMMTKLVIINLRHRGATKYDIEAEINFRKNHITVNDEKCFSYTTEELETALEYWNEF